MEKNTKTFTFHLSYQTWYSKSLLVIKNILPERLDDFIAQYKNSKLRKDITIENYTIMDYISRVPLYDWDIDERKGMLESRLLTQIGIIAAAIERIDFILSDIKGLIQADLFDSEIDAARELKSKKHLRAAGAIAGVVLEKHLYHVAQNHALTTKSKPTLNDLNECLKTATIYDIPTWRKIQSLADVRNLCAHGATREPTDSEVDDLLDGVDKIIKNIS